MVERTGLFLEDVAMVRQAAMCVIARMPRFAIAILLLPAVQVLTALLRRRVVRQAATAAVAAVHQAVRWVASVVAAVDRQAVRWVVLPHVAVASVVVAAAVADKQHRDRMDCGLIK